MNFYLKNTTSTNISLSGDKGVPSVSLSIGQTETVLSNEVVGNTVFCDSCASLITSGKLEVRVGTATGRLLTATDMNAIKDGTLFDFDQDGIVDFSDSAVRTAAVSVNMKDAVTEVTVKLPGDGSGRFVPLRVYFWCVAADTLSADGTFNLGTASGGTQYLAAQALTGLNVVNEVFRVDIAGTAIASIADNATLYMKMAAADSGTSGTMKVLVEGAILS